MRKVLIRYTSWLNGDEKDISYKELVPRLETHGVAIEVQVLINRVNQGKFSFAFAPEAGCEAQMPLL